MRKTDVVQIIMTTSSLILPSVHNNYNLQLAVHCDVAIRLFVYYAG